MDRLNEEFFSEAGKKFADNFKLVFNPEMFLLGVELGDEGEAYAMTPQHAKRLNAHIAHVIANYEKQFGEIKGGEWNPNVKSPFQISPPQSEK